MRRLIDIDSWKRRETYLFFRHFPNPFYNITVRMDVTAAHQRARKAGVRLSQYMTYASLKAQNSIEEFRYRQIDGQVWLYDAIRLNTPIPMPDHSFRSVIIPWKPTLEEFAAESERLREAALAGKGDAYSADTQKDTFCISINPWYDFTGMSFQLGSEAGEDIPLSVIGKMIETDGQRTVAVATRFHHGFIDGYHVGQYFEAFQHNLDTL